MVQLKVADCGGLKRMRIHLRFFIELTGRRGEGGSGVDVVMFFFLFSGM